MPGRDKTGPAGEGPMTGRSVGPCADNVDSPQMGVGRGLGCRGAGRRMGRRGRHRFGVGRLGVRQANRPESQPDA
ncbi:MAG: DUF5320 domain-containing protein [Phycisphaerales bacterium]|nr:DUF5320 domain-containing protein [Phycisphaerales bacterium]